MICFNGVYPDVSISGSGNFIKIPMPNDDDLIEYIVGTLINVDFETTTNYKGVISPAYATGITIGQIVAIKLRNHEKEYGIDY